MERAYPAIGPVWNAQIFGWLEDDYFIHIVTERFYFASKYPVVIYRAFDLMLHSSYASTINASRCSDDEPRCCIKPSVAYDVGTIIEFWLTLTFGIRIDEARQRLLKAITRTFRSYVSVA